LAALEKQWPGAQKLLDLTQFRPPLSLDSWDGYPAARARLLAALAQTDSNAIVVTGDSHAAWVNEIYSEDKQTRLAVEFAATSITSPGLGNLFSNAPFDFAQMLVESNDGIVWTDQVKRGFLLVTLRREEAFAEFIAVSSVTSKDYQVSVDARFRVATSAGPGVSKPEPAP
jgi:alkaline phosphatase D